MTILTPDNKKINPAYRSEYFVLGCKGGEPTLLSRKYKNENAALKAADGLTNAGFSVTLIEFEAD